ncbi:MAG: hypothetical protein JNK89_10260, partial [Saprospiraceae bacterium]|nr:hypothetical protein [Saprospiraceae bacterium]
DDPNQLSLGIIGIIDLDFGRGTITIGVMINFEIEELLKLSIPIEIFFNLRNNNDWHFYLGTIAQPASAEILNIVRGSAYFMIQGDRLVYADFGNRVPEFLRDKILPGVALAAGIEASILLGDPGSIYLRISAGLHVGVAFSPFIIVGSMFLEGELRLLIVSIGARGTFNALISQRPDGSYKTYLQGEICGSVSFFFFSISACVGLEIGTEDFDIQPPALINGLYLQSYAPVLTSGQGSAQKPIDASLGNAWDPAAPPPPDQRTAPVPIDTVPVLQLRFAPENSASLDANTFTNPILPAPGKPAGGWYQLSGDVELQYTLNSLTLTENGAAYAGERPPATWRLDRPHTPNGADTAIDLALFSRVPTAAEYAVERSTELRENITVRWGNLCRRAAPPARVLYTFCNQPLGPSMHGWRLRGSAWPDPPDTVRVEPPGTLMRVYAPEGCGTPSTLDMLLTEWGMPYDNPAEVIGYDGRAPESATGKGRRPSTKCYDLFLPERRFHRNPFRVEDALLIYSANTKRSIFDLRQGGFFSADTFEKNRRYPLRTQMRDVKNYRGISLREYMRIDVLQKPAQAVTLRFVSFNQKRTTLGVYAFNKEGKLVDQERWRPTPGKKIEQVTLQLSADDISYLIITNRYFTGLLLEVCLTRKPGADQGSGEQCHRALRLPYLGIRPVRRSPNLPQIDYKALEKYFEEKFARSCNYVTFETGGCAEVRVFGAVHKKLIDQVRVIECDQNDVELANHVLPSLPVNVISNFLTQLPAPWLQSGGPWRSRVVEVCQLMFSDQFNAYDKILVSIKPKPETRRIKIDTGKVTDDVPSVFVAIVETLTQGELQHHAAVTESIETDQETLSGYLNDNTPRPLLRPNSTYRLTANYTVIARHPERGEVYNQSHSQAFEFQTDNQAPAQLSPYVLGTTPDMDDRFHFFGDPVQVLFNDPTLLRLIDAYGKQLRAIIRGADGAPVALSPEDVHTLTETPASVMSPYRDTVLALIAAGLFPCAGGSFTFTGHGRYTAPFELKPLTPYTFDLEYTAPDRTDPGQAITPLYRRAFQTSRFRDVLDFAETHRIAAMQHRALLSDLTGLPSGAGPGTPVFTATDAAIENALFGAGVPIGDESEKTGFVILWRQEAGDAHFYPYAILIDAAEPMWRSRQEPLQRPVL